MKARVEERRKIGRCAKKKQMKQIMKGGRMKVSKEARKSDR